METAVEAAKTMEKRKLFIARFHAPDFPDILARVIHRTEKRMNSLTWMQIASGPAPAGKEATDIVHDVVVKALQNDDEVGPPEGASLENWLWDRAGSSVSNFVRSYENKMRKRSHSPGQDPVYDDGATAQVDEKTSDQAVVASELSEIAHEIAIKFTKTISDDAQLTSLLECLGAGILKREEIAQYLEITPAEVTNLRKRMKRREEEFASKNPDLNPFKKD